MLCLRRGVLAFRSPGGCAFFRPEIARFTPLGLWLLGSCGFSAVGCVRFAPRGWGFLHPEICVSGAMGVVCSVPNSCSLKFGHR